MEQTLKNAKIVVEPKYNSSIQAAIYYHDFSKNTASLMVKQIQMVKLNQINMNDLQIDNISDSE